ncbi:putative DNA-binding protein [Novosphingobium sp. Rr 2-17]|nr:putative DNA-binding protein [Novosphingobium sp. Rr 2-17]
MDTVRFLDRLYEAAALPDRWPAVLDDLARLFGAKGAVIFAAGGEGAAYHVASPGIDQFFQDYIDQGWMELNERGTPMIAALQPRFVTDTDFRPVPELRDMPVYRDFLIPLGAEAAAGTVVQGAYHDLSVMTLEGFSSHEAARAALPDLDALRPHIGRALSLMSRMYLGRANAMVQGLATLGAAAGVVGRNGLLRAFNEAFTDRFGDLMIEHRSRLRFTDKALDQAFDAALAASGRTDSEAKSVVVRRTPDFEPCVVHLLPLRRIARDLFEADGLLLLAAAGKNKSLPNADLLRLLFDLTPTEARIARRLLEGLTLDQAAAAERIAYATARVHLRSVFSKTGVHRQTELVQLLGGYS